MFEHRIEDGEKDFISINRKFPAAMSTDWRVFQLSKRYVVILIEPIGIEELTVD